MGHGAVRACGATVVSRGATMVVAMLAAVAMYEDGNLTETRPRKRRARGASDAPGWVLRLVFPRAVARRIALSNGERTIGRSGADLEIPDASVSRSHARLIVRGEEVLLADFGSRNGTWIDRGAVDTYAIPVADGAVIRIGDVLGVLERDEPDHDGAVDEDAVFGDAPAIRALRRRLPALAISPAPVLLLGETGTGKERLAGEVHRLSGRGAFVALNCAGLGPELADSHLFGHVRGAFTGADRAREGAFRSAHGGTLFLDEVAELAPVVQAKLLRSVETKEVVPLGGDVSQPADARIIAATHPGLLERVEAGSFRRDLYARLAMAELYVPPLRERRGDVPAWIGRLDARWRATDAGPPLALSADALEALMMRAWPENLRGLDRAVFVLRASLSGSGGQVDGVHIDALLSKEVPATLREPEDRSPSAPSPARREKPSEAELREVLQRFEGSVRAVAKHYGRDRRQIYRWLDAYGLR